MEHHEQVAGVLLCRVADHRIAFVASHVVSVEPWSESSPAPHARSAFSLPGAAGRVLRANAGELLAVDRIEVHAEPVALMPPPPVLLGGLGGSLAGFIVARDQLWPLLHLAEFSRFLVERRA